MDTVSEYINTVCSSGQCGAGAAGVWAGWDGILCSDTADVYTRNWAEELQPQPASVKKYLDISTIINVGCGWLPKLG